MTVEPASVLVIAGPTASGKSSYALQQARTHDGVVINADSVQLYDALPVLTAQPSAADRDEIPHRLYGVLPPQETCSAPRWCALALVEIRAAQADGRLPVVTGGTGFYLKALIEGLSPIPDTSPEVRAKAISLQEKLGNPAFHEALAQRDPEMARRLHPNDTQRLIRAWEVMEDTGKSLAYWQALPPVPPAELKWDIVIIMPPRDVLRRNCDERFERMMAEGALDEIAALNAQIEAGEVPAAAPATAAIGFEPLRRFLKGEITRKEAEENTKALTRQYAKRQVTWFRRQLPQARFIAGPSN